MDALLTSAARLLVLGVPALLGVLAGASGLFSDPKRAVTVLNRYALNIGFPALIGHGLVQASAVFPDSPWFWALWPVALAGIVVALWCSPVPRPQAATLGLVTSFGNIAYLGLPYVLAVYGDGLAGPAVLLVTVHVTGAVTVGPALLIGATQTQGSRARQWRELAAGVVKMPLFWAPWVGAGARMLPDQGRELAASLVGPVAGSAAPVALFLLGLHVFVERRRLLGVGRALWTHVAIRQGLAPAVVLLLALGLSRGGLLSVELARLHVVMASMPVGIATFSMAHHAGFGEDRVAGSVVASSLLCVVSLPIWVALSDLLL